MVDAVEPFLYTQSVTDRTPGNIEPDSVFWHHPDRLDDERGVVRPLAYRVAIKARLSNLLAYLHPSIHQLWEFSSISPDNAPRLRVLIQDRYLELVLKDLRLPEVIEIRPRESDGFTFVPWIVIKSRENCISSD